MKSQIPESTTDTITVREWFRMWLRCLSTLRIFGKLGRGLAKVQLVQAFFSFIILPLMLFVTWLMSFVLALLRRSAPESKDTLLCYSPLERVLHRKESSLWLALQCARHTSIDETFVHLTTLQSHREQGHEHELFVAAETSSNQGEGVMLSPLRPFITASQTRTIIESVAAIVGTEMFLASLGTRDTSEGGPSKQLTHTVALMAPNSIFYPSIWMGISRSAVTMTALDLSVVPKAGSNANPRSKSAGDNKNKTKDLLHSTRHVNVTYSHSCNAALLNTNVANNDMLVRTIAASGSSMLIIDASFVWLLFTPSSSGSGGSSGMSDSRTSSAATRRAIQTQQQERLLLVSLPPAIKKILLWHTEPVVLPSSGARPQQPAAGGSGGGTPPSSPSSPLPYGITLDHLRAISDFNDSVCTLPRNQRQVFQDELEELSALWLSNLVLFCKYPRSCTSYLTVSTSSTTAQDAATASSSSVEAARRRSASPVSASANNNNNNTKSNGTGETSPILSFLGGKGSQGSSSGGGSSRESAAKERSNSNHGTKRKLSNPPPLTNANRFPLAGSPPTSPPLDITTSPLEPPSIAMIEATEAARSACGSRVTSTAKILLQRRMPLIFATLVLDSAGFAVEHTPFEKQRLKWATLILLIRRAISCYRPTDCLLKIYTSGTTGLPKAAKFSHLRFHAGINLSFQLDVTRRTARMAKELGVPDYESVSVLTVYNALPMYHSAGGVFCTSHLMACMQLQLRRHGLADGTVPSARMVVRRKFSASSYAKELLLFRVHVVQYIGEVLRYALAAMDREVGDGGGTKMTTSSAGHKDDSSFQWKVPVAFGNGLRKDIWNDVLNRLPIHSLVEFYASTEGNVGIMNIYDEPFAVGHMPVFPPPFERFSPTMWRMFPMKLVEYDPNTEEPKRYADGRCRVVSLGTEGELIGAVQRGFDPIGIRRFDGYDDVRDTNKKLLRHVLRNGDLYFRSGDILRVDRRGFVSFVDRVGDTFRWKGENVSTLEVANAMNRVETSQYRMFDAVVYGVAVEGREGKAGMAKISLMKQQCADPAAAARRRNSDADEEKRFFSDRLFALLSDKSAATSLPMYAVPVFLRVTDAEADLVTPAIGIGEADMTSTFKHKKTGLMAESFYAAVPSMIPSHLSEQQTKEAMTPASCEARYYVLVCGKVMHQYRHGASGLPTSSSAGSGTAGWGYIPLSETTVAQYCGNNFQLTGW